MSEKARIDVDSRILKFLLTSLSRKLEYQQELVLLLVQAVNNGFCSIFYILPAKVKKLT